MGTKKGISLVVLVITIIVMVIMTGIVIVQTDNALDEVEKDDFVLDLTTIADKSKEYYLLMGNLPVKAGVEYTADEMKTKLTDTAAQNLLISEITTNKDTNNTFYAVDLELLQLETDDRGKYVDNTDVFVIASSSLNVYYLKGVEIEGVLRFSLATLTPQNVIEESKVPSDTQVDLNTQLSVTKSTNAWTNEISLVIQNDLGSGETLQYSIGGAAAKAVGTSKVILINASNMTTAEKTAFGTNKTVTINKLESGSVIETKEIAIDNLDITSPTLGTMTLTDSSDEDYNIIKINSSDEGGSGVKSIYYDYATKLVDGAEALYYTDRSTVSAQELVNLGKASKDGTIKLTKNIKSIVVVAIDNAGNSSAVSAYSIDDTYLTSE